jgi:TatD DNase family protein
MNLFDTHCHLQDPALMNDIDGVISRAQSVGVTHMLCCATSEKDWDSVLQISKAYSRVDPPLSEREGIGVSTIHIIPALGIHPWYLSDRSSDWLDKLEESIKASGACIGEIGIDHAVEHRNDEEQHQVFIDQLKLAKKYNRPASIHCRKAWASLMEILKDVGGSDAGWVIHSYSGPADLVAQLEQLGCYISFSGTITRTNNKRGHAALAAVSKNRLLIETDSPDLSPAGAASTVNEPANLSLIASSITQKLAIPYGEIAELTLQNSLHVFAHDKS